MTFSESRSPSAARILLFLSICVSTSAYGLAVEELDSFERKSLSLACDKQASENLCYRKQLYALEKIGRNRQYPELHRYEYGSLHNGCKLEYSKGPALYVFCLKREFNKWKSSTHAKLKVLDKSIQDTLRGLCDDAFGRSLSDFNQCVITELPKFFRKPSQSKPLLPAPEAGKPEPQSAHLRSKTPEELFRLLSPSIVYVASKNGSGSGVVITNSLVISNQHVIEGAGQITVSVGKRKYNASVVWADSKMDTCLLRVDTKTLTPINGKRNFKQLQIGERVYALGNPEGLEKTFSDGIISGKRVMSGQKVIQTTAPITYGSSGGGLFDKDGNLIGITVGGYKEGNLNFAVPIDAFREP